MNTRQGERGADQETDLPPGQGDAPDPAEAPDPPAAPDSAETEAARGTADKAPPGETDKAPPGETDKAPPGETDKAPPGETDKAPPGETDKAPSGSDEAPGETDDEVWSRFAPVPERPAGRIRRAANRVGLMLVHEWTLASLAGLLLAVLMTWPTLRDPARTIPQDIWDPTLQAWQVAWAGHALLTDPAQLWHANAFWPERYGYAFSDSLLGYAPFGLVGDGPIAAVVRYNILFVLAYALAFVGGYALIRQLGAGPTGAAVAGAAFAYAPWRLAQAGHLHVMSSGGILLALAMLARGHGWSLRHGYRTERRRAGWALAGWLVAAWQVSLGFGIGLPFVYLLALVVVVGTAGWIVHWIRRKRRPFSAWLLLADLGGGLIFGMVALLMALPYLTVLRLHPYAARSPEEVTLYSSPLRGFVTAPLESWLWGERHAAARAMLSPADWEKALLPGFVLIGLAAAGLLVSIWSVRTRILLAAGVAVTAVLCMGTEFGDGGRPGYMTLYDVLPGWSGIRTPGRLVLWTTLLLVILAAGAVSAFAERAAELTADRIRVPAQPGPLLRLATLIPLVLVLVEGVNVTPHPQVPRAPAALRGVEDPVLVLPSTQGIDQNAMLWSTDGFPRLVNGSSGFIPAGLQRTREAAATFPDPASIAYLRELGVRTVVLLPDRTAGTPWERAAEVPVDALDIGREEVDGVLVFHLNP